MTTSVAWCAVSLWLAAATFAEETWQVARTIAEFDRFDIVQPGVVDTIKKNNEVKVNGKCITGGVECDIEVPETGWYELFADPEGGLNECVVDGTLSIFGGGNRKLPGQDRYSKLDNLWLEKGKHTFRIQRYIWWGFSPPAKGILLRRADSSVPKTFRVEYAHGPGEAILRKGGSLGLTVITAGRTEPAALTVELRDAGSGQVEATATAELPASAGLQKVPVKLPCNREGIFSVKYAVGGAALSTYDQKPMIVYVVDASPPQRSGDDLAKTLLQETDCAAKEPDYSSGGATEVVTKPLGKYRLSGEVGFLYAQHHNTPESWFAYTLATPDVGKPHVLEVDYPDDDCRTFLIAIRESSADDYPVAGGVDTGGCWSLSNGMLTHSLLFWPKTASPRVAFLAAHNGRRAAAARVRVYRVDGEIPVLNVPATGGRTFLNWYEEGSNFAGFYGGGKANLVQFMKAAEMWPRELSYMGGNMIVPTVSVYQMSLYPSRYSHHFAEMTQPDIVRLLLLKCERYGTTLVAEFHPEARELEYPLAALAKRENGLASKTGQICNYDTGGPRHHPLHPRNQEWYVGMVGEIADRYKDSPAFGGVSLRNMSWSNPALNNFHSLDWGYDDCTVGLFEKETGTKIPCDAADAGRFAKRCDWLMKNAQQQWVDWRCDRIVELYRKLVARIRAARKDLLIYATVHDLGKDAGIDADKLSQVDGLVLVNCRHPYGRRALTYEGYLADQKYRDRLLDPEVLNSTRGTSGVGAFLFGAGYFEATEAVLKPVNIGLPANTKQTWISGVVNPAGRHFLERYAIALAATDALMLGDGGNAYTLGQPLLREFTNEFRRLPPTPFKPRKDARDPVAVWELPRDGEFLFYAVNRERYPVHVSLTVKAKGPVRRLATGDEAALKEGQLLLDLRPYQLLTFHAPAGTEIAQVSLSVPDEDRKHAQALVDAVGKLADDAQAGNVTLSDAGRQLLTKTLDEARLSLREGRLWRARTILEHNQLAELVYNKALVFPPTLEYLADTRNLLLARARGMSKPGNALLHIAFDQLDAGKIPVTGKLALQAECEGACELRDGKLGRALHLDGKTGRVVVKGDGLSSLNLKDFTVSVWVNGESVGGRRGILSRQKGSAGFALLFWNGSVLAEGGSQARNTGCRTSDGFCTPNAWHHLAATLQSGKAMKLYVDGFEAKNALMNHDVGPADVPLLIGWNGWGGKQNDPSPGWFAGTIDELKVWDRVLTAEEIAAEMVGK